MFNTNNYLVGSLVSDNNHPDISDGKVSTILDGEGAERACRLFSFYYRYNEFDGVNECTVWIDISDGTECRDGTASSDLSYYAKTAAYGFKFDDLGTIATNSN